MTEAKSHTPDFHKANYCCGEAALHFRSHTVLIAHGVDYYRDFYEREGREYFAKAAAALGYRLVQIEPEAVTSEPGFDNRDGGRMHERSSAQEG